MTHTTFLNRAVGLLVIEVVNSNPNGDPDRESDPRTRPDDRGEISPVSFKRKIRDLIADKEGPVWQNVGTEFDPKCFDILEVKGRHEKEIVGRHGKEIVSSEFLGAYWDARVFGTTFLEKKDQGGGAIQTGVVQFGLGVSIAPIVIERQTTTNKAGVQEGKDRGMAPLGYRIVQHGVYCMPFFVNPTAAHKTNCTEKDIELLKKVIPYTYTQTASYARTHVNIRHAWFAEHSSPLGNCSDFLILEALQPKKKSNPDKASTSWDDYNVPNSLPSDIVGKVKLIDLIG